MKKFLSALGLVILTLSSLPSEIQGQLFTMERFAVEPRLGIAFPTGDFGNADPSCPVGSAGCDYPDQTGVETGLRWDVRIHYRLSDRVTMVGSFGKTKFGCSGPFCGSGSDPETRDLSLGFRAMAFDVGSMGIWAEGGAAVEKFSIIRTRNETGEAEPSRVWYPWSFGIYGGGGVELPLTGDGNFFFTPGFHFRHVSSDPPSSDPDLQPVTATYILAQVGFKVVLARD
jgi:hypothetical protein